ncbi:MAG: hypothetical protein M1822_004650 [Bathelium mastoideum]|nr:MAG: hypothetical protein M1822_004650 [Bathelium mastoideum]
MTRSPTKDGKGRHGSPVLRTSEGLVVPGCALNSEDEFDESSSPDLGSTTESSDTEQPKPPRSTTSTTLRIPSNLARSHAAISSPSTASSTSSSALYTTRHHTHRHTIDYVTTRQPPSPTAYTLLRRACINTLSVESLPRGASAGFLFFGDAHKGYTLAYVFRVPDPRARGRWRTYALLMLGGHAGWRTTRAYRAVTRAFENMAARIVRMANAVIVREFGESKQAQGARGSGAEASAMAAAAEAAARPLSRGASGGGGSGAGGGGVDAGSGVNQRNITPVSSFLVAKKVDPDGYPRGSSEAMSAKSLAEIVGDENIFLELHGAFVKLLASLTREFGL